MAPDRSSAALTKDQSFNEDQPLTKDQSTTKDPVSMGNELWRFSYTSPGKRSGPAPDSTKVDPVSPSSRKKSSRLPLDRGEDLELQHSGKKQKCELEPKPVDTICTVKADDPSPLDAVLKETHTRIFYATRTHFQIAQVRVLHVFRNRALVQVVDELQKTKYKPKTIILVILFFSLNTVLFFLWISGCSTSLLCSSSRLSFIRCRQRMQEPVEDEGSILSVLCQHPKNEN